MQYFVMTCKGEYPTAALKKGPQLGPPWYSGRVIAGVPEPLIYTLDPERPGNIIAMYDDIKYPLIRDDLLHALISAGVDNLQLFEAVIQDTANKKEYNIYKAFNVVGVVSAADMDKSVLMGISQSRMIDTDFDSLAIDEKKAIPFKLFRLAENVSAIIADSTVKEMVEQCKIKGMEFYDPQDWSG